MVIVMFACSEKAYGLMQELKGKWEKAHPEDAIITLTKCSALKDQSAEGSISELTGEWFGKADALFYLCATGIAVRSIAPYLRHKAEDPAVLVIDESGRFCISLLSGHAGGANLLAGEAAFLLREKGAAAVITTATDREGKFSVDEFAMQNHLVFKDWDLAKQISAKILQGEKISLVSDYEICGGLPQELTGLREEAALQIRISCRREREDTGKRLDLIPQALVVGIGCRKGTPEEEIAQAIARCFAKEGLLSDGICALASMDRKAEEKGILSYCEKNNIPFLVYAGEKLARLEGVFSGSAFVTQITGVDNVCERSALLGARELGPEAALIVRKQTYGRVTVAVAERKVKLKRKTGVCM